VLRHNAIKTQRSSSTEEVVRGLEDLPAEVSLGFSLVHDKLYIEPSEQQKTTMLSCNYVDPVARTDATRPS
jgi:hypothetical protein